ncbi:MAG TPA: CBS domain-containing protein [Candidatus Saccharimonadales bacterium]|nr:CBS domain-containing protein [Candidatus Saccharimonadales bacterium]
MLTFILAIAFLLLAVAVLALRQSYRFVPLRELKRQARSAEPLAKSLYRAAAYGTDLEIILWLLIAVCLLLSFALLSAIAPSILAFIVEALAIGLAYAWMPDAGLAKISPKVVVLVTPLLIWVLEISRPLLKRVSSFLNKHQVSMHSGLYERDDLLRLLEQQKEQSDSRIPQEQLDLLISALTYGDKAVYECMVPRRVVRSISAEDSVGPVLIRDLHDSGFSRFPVFHEKPDNFVGTLYIRDLIDLKHTGKVKDVMEQAVFYVHEEYPLEQVLHAFLKTKHHLFIVVDKFEEYVGIITIEDIIEQILGCKIVDEFDSYDDLRAVAADHARHEHKAHKKDHEEPAELKPEKKDPEPDEITDKAL